MPGDCVNARQLSKRVNRIGVSEKSCSLFVDRSSWFVSLTPLLARRGADAGLPQHWRFYDARIPMLFIGRRGGSS